MSEKNIHKLILDLSDQLYICYQDTHNKFLLQSGLGSTTFQNYEEISMSSLIHLVAAILARHVKIIMDHDLSSNIQETENELIEQVLDKIKTSFYANKDNMIKNLMKSTLN